MQATKYCETGKTMYHQVMIRRHDATSIVGFLRNVHLNSTVYGLHEEVQYYYQVISGILVIKLE